MQYDTQHLCRCSLFRRFFRTWQSRRVSWTKDAVDFARTDEDVVADSVPMHEIMSIAAITEQPSPESLWTASQEDLANQSCPVLNDEQRSNDGQLFVNEQGDCTFTAGNSDSDTRHCTMLMANAPSHPSAAPSCPSSLAFASRALDARGSPCANTTLIIIMTIITIMAKIVRIMIIAS